MQRVLLIGSPGAGKSTLGRRLHQRTGLPLIHLDRLFWTAGWIEREKAEHDALLNQALAGERWIIDGNYGSSLPRRVARADTILWLDYPTYVCLRRILHRWWIYRGRSRPDMPDNCPERLDVPFLWFVATFRRRWHSRNSAALAAFAGRVVRLRSPQATERWLRTLVG